MAEASISPIKLGRISSSDNLGAELHNGARNGNKRQLKKALGRGIQVDYPNDRGQTPLFCACSGNQGGTAEILLSHGADPNERSIECLTPVHVTAYNGNIKLLTQLLSAGGDLRLHDGCGRTSKDWALLQPDPKKRLKMLEFLEKTRLFAMTKSGHDIRVDYRTNNSRGNSLRNNSVMRLIKDKIMGSPNVSLDQIHSCQSMGFGKVYLDGESSSGFVSTIPLVTETNLKHDPERLTYENGAFMVMESMCWRRTEITAKRLHRETEVGGEVDLLINEIELLGKLRHPNILCVMGVCQTNNLDGMVILFESIYFGSLYFHLHHQLERMPTSQISEITKQICDALIFIHEQNYLHCYVTSHAINLVNNNCAKLGNFEYMIESDKAEIGKRSLVNTNIYQNAAYNWMAPEVMNQNPPSVSSDMYSFCAVIWEMIHCEIPWGHLDVTTLRYKILEEREQLIMKSRRISQIYHCLLEYGLQLDPLHRKLKFGEMKAILKLPPDQSVQQFLHRLERPERPSTKPDARKMMAKPKTSPGPQPNAPDMSYTKETQGTSFGSSPSPKHRNRHQSDPHYDQNQREMTRNTERKHLQDKAMVNEGNRKHHHQSDRQDRKQTDNNPMYPELDNYNQEDKNNYRFTDGMQFTHKNLRWKLQEEQEGDKYHYTADIQNLNGNSGKKPYNIKENVYRDIHHENLVPSETEETCSSQTSQTSTDICYPLETKFSRPLAKFSYLQIQQMSSPPGTSIKPASHCVEPTEKITGGQLTTKGSVYALYNQLNDGCQNFTPDTSTVDFRGQCLSTMPRKRKRMGATPNVKTPGGEVDSNWFGGKGSVRNLVDLYQHQADGHQFNQAVLDGQVKNPLQEIRQRKADEAHGINNYNCSQESSPKKQQLYPDMDRFIKTGQYHNSLENKPNKKDDLHNIINSSNQNKVSPQDVQSTSSIESDMISSWVSQEIQKVSSSLSDEIFSTLAEKQTKSKHTPRFHNILSRQSDYTPNSPRYGGQSPYKAKGKVPHKEKRNKYNKKEKGKKENIVEDFYIDDELYSKNCHEKQMNLQSCAGEMLSHRRSSFIMPETSTDTQIQEYHRNMDQIHVGKQMPRYVPASTPSTYEKLKNRCRSRGAYESTVTVTSSRTDPDQHYVSHTLTDLSDGTTSVVYGKSVRASKVVSSLFTKN